MGGPSSPPALDHLLATATECPSLVIGGDADHLVPREYTIELNQLLADARPGIIRFASHVCSQEQSDRFSVYISEFLQEPSPACR